MSLIFETVHGSHLYGLNHAESDRDVFFVTDSDSRHSRHSMNSETGLDQVRTGLKTFLRRVEEGSHQSVEALFSPYKFWHQPEYAPMIESIRVTGGAVFAKYERTIKNFCHGNFKKRRHACRLALNLASLRESGRFNPAMTETEKVLANSYAKQFEGDTLVPMLIV